ncbi:dodecin family protein [Rhodohalobacter halophilus]|uniref:dodecin family protein n=1 Tax=Rhodohalobacter halophilus TaxID=1812810 RepID=UPI00083F83B5|nr:dodecin family protein [Rhodohalobacter halophilus]
MSLAKVIEVIAEGKSMEEAISNTVKQASKTVHNIRSVYCENMQGIVENNKVVKFRVNAKITFVLEDQKA